MLKYFKSILIKIVTNIITRLINKQSLTNDEVKLTNTLDILKKELQKDKKEKQKKDYDNYFRTHS